MDTDRDCNALRVEISAHVGSCVIRVHELDPSVRTSMSKQQELEARLQDVLTVIQSVTPPFLPADAQVMTVMIEWPPGDPGAPPHRHPGGPAFGYVLEGEMLFELEGSRRGPSIPARRSGNPVET